MRQIGEEDLTRSATALVTTALHVSAGERFVVVGDQGSQPMLAALERAARETGAEVAALRIDQHRSYSTNHSGERPRKVLPDAVRRAMLSAQASAFVASSPQAEASMRDQLLHIVGACSIRHAHMPAITPVAFTAGLAVDYGDVREWGRAVERRLEVAREVSSISTAGTKLIVAPGGRRWVSRLGRVEPGQSVTFPCGSLLTSPEDVNGTFAASASLGEFFGAREGILGDPVFFEIEAGRVVAVKCEANPPLVRDIEATLRAGPNSDRVGLVILGVNPGIGDPTGQVSVDQHRPGLHLTFGDPLSKLTAAGWSARTSFAATQVRSSVRIDGMLVIDDGAITVS